MFGYSENCSCKLCNIYIVYKANIYIYIYILAL